MMEGSDWQELWDGSFETGRTKLLKMDLLAPTQDRDPSTGPPTPLRN